MDGLNSIHVLYILVVQMKNAKVIIVVNNMAVKFGCIPFSDFHSKFYRIISVIYIPRPPTGLAGS